VSFGEKKTNELVVTCNKLKNKFVGLITRGLGSDVARESPVERYCPYVVGEVIVEVMM
jgi:hypothetical protein